MRIIECYIENFGTISKERFTFSEGFNLIFSKNGTGKTTLFSFIKAMLYGIGDTRRTSLDENARRRYAPWGGGAFGGAMTLISGERLYRIERRFGAKSSEDILSVTDGKTGLKVDLGDPLGESLLGIDAEGFERTLYLSERRLSPSDDRGSVAARLSDTVNSGGDGGDLEAAMKRLDDQRRELYKKGGGGKIADLRRELFACEVETRELEALEAGMQAGRLRREEIRASLSALDEREERLNLDRAAAARAEARSGLMNEAKQKRQRLQELRRREEEIKDFLGGRIPTELEIREAAQKKERADALSLAEGGLSIGEKNGTKGGKALKTGRGGEKGIRHRFYISLLAISAVLTAVLYPTGEIIGALWLKLLPPGIFCIIGAVYILSVLQNTSCRRKEKKDAQIGQGNRVEDEAERLLSEYSAFILSTKARGEDPIAEIRAAREDAEGVFAEIKALSLELSYIEGATDVTGAPKSAEELESERRSIGEQRARLTEELFTIDSGRAAAEEKASRLGELKKRKQEIAENLKKCEEKLTILQLAAEYLEKARSSMNAKHLGGASEKFREYVGIISGEVSEVGLSSELSCFRREGGVTRPTEAYSRGLRELYGLCARLALSASMFKEDLPPVLLDDPFTALDDEKVGRALSLIRAIAAERQVIYATCSASRK